MDSFEKYFALSLRYLQFRIRSEKEVRDYLQKKHTSRTVVDTVIEKLKQQRLLSDVDFAHAWIASRLRLKPKSRELLKRELRQKGIADEIIDEQFLSQEEEVDNAQLAKNVVVKKLKLYKHLPKEALYRRLGGVLARRGFSWEISKRAIDEVLEDSI